MKHILSVIGVRLIELMGPVLSDKFYLKLKWRFKMGGKLNLDNPKTFNEKLQWLKLYDRKPEYTTMVDKVKVKDYVAEKIGAEYIIPTIGVWDTPEEIDFDLLPNQFVLKCSHNSGGLFICKDKTKVSKEKWKSVLAGLKKSLKYDYYMLGREWPYKNVERKILAEQYMVDESGYELKDYKFFCFNGKPKAMFIAVDRGVANKETKFNFYDMDFKLLPFTNGHSNSEKSISKPNSFELMKELATTLSKDMPHVRIDFYDIYGKVYLGEITFFHWSGFVPFNPKEWDYKFGEWIKLPS